MGVDSSISGLLFTPAFAGEEDLAGCPATDAVALMRSLHVVEVEILVEDPLHGRRPILRAWKGMRLDVERDVDLGVPQSLLNYHAMDSLLDHEAVGGVTQVVGPYIGQPGRGMNPLGPY
jgi:hypothetical protein